MVPRPLLQAVVAPPLIFNSHMATRGGGDPLGLRYSSFLNVGYVNLNSLLNKVSHVDYNLNSENIDVFGIGETWLINEISDSYVEINGYKLIRKDDPLNIRKHGVAIYIKMG